MLLKELSGSVGCVHSGSWAREVITMDHDKELEL